MYPPFHYVVFKLRFVKPFVIKTFYWSREEFPLESLRSVHNLDGQVFLGDMKLGLDEGKIKEKLGAAVTKTELHRFEPTRSKAELDAADELFAALGVPTNDLPITAMKRIMKQDAIDVGARHVSADTHHSRGLQEGSRSARKGRSRLVGRFGRLAAHVMRHSSVALPRLAGGAFFTQA